LNLLLAFVHALIENFFGRERCMLPEHSFREARSAAMTLMPSDNRIVDFYGGVTPDHRGRYLDEILAWSDDDLESVHDYIQWLFPLAELSGFNPSAPVLEQRAIQEFRSRPDLQRKMRTSFLRMLGFYGLEFIEAWPPAVRRARSYAARSENWLTVSNHNHLRITRILRSMRTLGLQTEARVFFDCLVEIYSAETAKDSPGISDESFRFWEHAVTSG
jgi:Opioid growth factor receptor (OGFr) conserved region